MGGGYSTKLTLDRNVSHGGNTAEEAKPDIPRG